MRPALAALQRTLALLPDGHAGRDLLQGEVRRCEQSLVLAEKLLAVLNGKARAGADEQAALARMCLRKRLYTHAVHFFEAAFAAHPPAAEDLSGARYDAACAAVLAGQGSCRDAFLLDDAEYTRLRRQALAWLRADLAAWSQRLASGRAEDRPVITGTMRHWKQDTDLAGVRDGAALGNLPEAERRAWRQLWADVAALLARVAARE
jgi:hypothetical protein